MAGIMEFILNLLLLRGKLLTTTAASTFHKAIKKCMHFKRKISVEYNSGQIIVPFENMLDFVNYNSKEYKCEDGKYIVTSEVQYMFEQRRENPNLTQFLYKEPTDRKSFHTLETPRKNLQELPKKQNIDVIPKWVHDDQGQGKSKKKPFNEDHIVDNIRAIMKSQEYLFKNIVKLVDLLEKDEVLGAKNAKLVKVKRKLVACTDILSNNTHPHQFSNVINNIIEEEITRCRFKIGESKTSKEISLKAPKPEGLAAVLDPHKKSRMRKEQKPEVKAKKVCLKSASGKKIIKFDRKNEVLRKNEINSEVKASSQKLLRRAKTEPFLKSFKPHKKKLMPTRNFENILKQTQAENENMKKLIETNEKHFNKCEDALWHSLTTAKFLSLKDDYLKECKCAFYNKRQFVATEAVISKKIQQEEEMERFQNFDNISNSMFQITERKLLFETVKQELKKIGQLPISEDIIPSVNSKFKNSDLQIVDSNHFQENNPFLKLNESANTELADKVLNNLLKCESNLETNLKQQVQEDKVQQSSSEIEPKSDGLKDEETKQNSQLETKQSTDIIQTNSDITKDATIPKAEEARSESSKSEDSVLKNQHTTTVINKNNLQEFLPNFDEGISVAVLEDDNFNLVESKEKTDSPSSDKDSNTIINSLEPVKREEIAEQKNENKPDISEQIQNLDEKNQTSADKREIIESADKGEIIETEGKSESADTIPETKTETTAKTSKHVEKKEEIFEDQLQDLNEAEEKIVSKDAIIKTESKGAPNEKKPETKNQSITNYNLKKHDDMSPVITKNYRVNQLKLKDKRPTNTQNTSKFFQYLSEKASLKSVNKPQSFLKPQDISSHSNLEKKHINPGYISKTEKAKKPVLEQESKKHNVSASDKDDNLDLYTRKYEQDDDNVNSKTEGDQNDERKSQSVSAAVQNDSKKNKKESASKVLRDAEERNAMAQILQKQYSFSSSSNPKTKNVDEISFKKNTTQNVSVKKEVFLYTDNKCEEIHTNSKDEAEKNKKEDELVSAVKKAAPKPQGKQSKEERLISEAGSKQQPENKTGKLNKSSPQLMNAQEIKNEADMMKTNEAAFDELENTIRSVRIIGDKTPSKTGKPVKTTTESKKRKIDEPDKKNLSTKRHITRQFTTYKNQESASSLGDADEQQSRLSLYQEIKKQVTSLPNSKTFLKKEPKGIFQNGRNPLKEKNENRKSSHSFAKFLTGEENKEKKKPRSQMRRTTKNAIKRQQVQTALPKMLKQKEDKKKSFANLFELERKKSSNVKPSKYLRLPKKYTNRALKSEDGSALVKNVSSPTVCKNVVKKMLKKESNEKIHYVLWETDDANVPKILKY